MVLRMLNGGNRRFYAGNMDGFGVQAGEEGGRKRRYERILQAGMEECLTARQREIAQLYYFGGMTMEQVGERLGIGTPTVSRSLKASRKKLRLVSRLTEIILRG